MRLKPFFAVLLLCATGFGQGLLGDPLSSGSSNPTLTVNPVGGGSGSVVSADGNINCSWNGSSSSGTCSHTYTGSPAVTLNVSTTSGSTFAWSNGVGNANVCSGSGSCFIASLTGASSVSAVFLAAGSAAFPAFNMGLGMNALSNVCPPANLNQFPTNISTGTIRFWDATQVQWPSIETASNAYNFTSWLDPELCSAAVSGVKNTHWTMARTPFFATSGSQHTDAGVCNYYSYPSSAAITAIGEASNTVTVTSTLNPGAGNTVVITGVVPAGYNGAFTVVSSSSTQFTYTDSTGSLGTATNLGGANAASVPSNLTNSAPGQCDPPTDLNANGTGANLYWRNGWAGIIAHVNQPGYIQGTGTWAAGGANCSGSSNCPHAPVGVWDVWNEPDTCAFWSCSYGTFDQLHRVLDDTYCMVKGGAYYIAGGVTGGQFVQALVSTSGTTMTWVYGTPFNTSWSSVAVNLNGTAYTISSCASSTTCTLSTSAGTKTNVLLGEKITQGTTSATAEMMGAPINTSDLINLWANASGSPDGTHTWTGSLSGATYVPTAVPTALTVAATSESCATVRGTINYGSGTTYNVNTALFPNFPAQPLDTFSTVIMPSYHGPTTSTALAQHGLYCTGTGCSGGTCPNPSGAAVSCTDGGWHLTSEAINFHLKPGGTGASNPTPFEPTLLGYVNNIHAILQSAELLKPLYNTENAFSTCGWPTTACDNNNVWGINNMEGAFLGDEYVYSWYLGISEDVLYDWNNGHGGLGALGAPCTVNQPLGCANVAFNTTYGWLVGSTAISCSISNGAGTNSLYTCTLTSASGTPETIMWDNAELCTGTYNSGSGTWTSVSCPTQNEPVNSSYTTYYDIYGDAGQSIISHSVPIGIAPVLMH
jgi:hypothetical protein